ncbi:MAG TPA: NTP transferase domain-containing protein, partial [Ornithinibacter sp.]|nr:NTP transferase domain-containing protein [Ornithinibacter sp.]
MTDQRPTTTSEVTVVVLAGGTSRRFGSDKLGARLHGVSVLEMVVASLPESWPVVVVGPIRECGRL